MIWRGIWCVLTRSRSSSPPQSQRASTHFFHRYSVKSAEIERAEKDTKKKKGKAVKQKKDLTNIFPGQLVRPEDAVPGISQAKLRGDDLFIMERLVNKYDDDFEAMAKNIKLNYM